MRGRLGGFELVGTVVLLVGSDIDGASAILDAFKTATAPPPTAAPRAKKVARMRVELGMAVTVQQTTRTWLKYMRA
jgi:hypothetical protein